MLDELTKLQIDLGACKHALTRPDRLKGVPIGAQISDDDIRATIRELFADEEEFEDWMTDLILAEYKEMEELQAHLSATLPGLMMAAFGAPAGLHI